MARVFQTEKKGKVHSHGIQLRELKGLIGIREIKRLTDERLMEVRRIVEGDEAGLIEKIEGKGSLGVNFDGYKKGGLRR